MRYYRCILRIVSGQLVGYKLSSTSHSRKVWFILYLSTSFADDMKEGVILLSYRRLNFNETVMNRKKQEVKNDNRSVLKSIFNKILKPHKTHTEDVQSELADRGSRIKMMKKSLEAELEIERFQRDFILPLETAENCHDVFDGKSESLSSEFDSGNFSESSSYLSPSLSSSSSLTTTTTSSSECSDRESYKNSPYPVITIKHNRKPR